MVSVGEPPLLHSRARARAYAACLGCLGTALGFFLLAIVRVPVLLYFPLRRRFALTVPGQGVVGAEDLSMDYYGRSLWALALGAALAALGYVYVVRRDSRKPLPPMRPPSKDQRLLLVALYALTLQLLAAGLYGYQLATRSPSPEPLPSWYVPR